MGEEKTMELYRSGSVSFEAVIITEERESVLTDGIADGDFEIEKESYTIRNHS